jgi:hypothetical protein
MTGFRSSISIARPELQWPAMKSIHVVRVRWSADHWENDGEPSYTVDQSSQTLTIDLDSPQAILVTW